MNGISGAEVSNNKSESVMIYLKCPLILLDVYNLSHSSASAIILVDLKMRRMLGFLDEVTRWILMKSLS